VDFTNRAADLNPEDIESVTVLKGAEAAALYGIDAANGAIVITTKRGSVGTAGLQYSNNFRFDRVRKAPEVQRTFAPLATPGVSSFVYFGPRYADTTTFYDNVSGFFRTGENQNHNLSFSGAAPGGQLNYRISTGIVRTTGVVPNNDYGRTNLTGATGGQVRKWLNTDLSLSYTNATNDQTFKGGVTGNDGGPLIGLLVWPATDDARNYLSPAGTRRRLTTLAQTAEVDNPYFNVNKNSITSRNNRIVGNLGLTFTPFSWGSLQSRIGTDSYTNTNQLLRSPESALGFSQNGILDVADDITRNLNVHNILQFSKRRLFGGLQISGLLGNQINDFRSQTNALLGQNFLDPNFVSVNNSLLRGSRSVLAQRRLIGAYGSAQLDWNDYLFVTLQGRNDWTSTIPRERNSFFYPSVTSSFVFTDAFPSLKRVFSAGKLRGAYAEVGRDARPYAYAAALEAKTSVGGGYGYGFTGPNPNLKPEFARSYEFGTELSFLQDRLGLDATVYRKQTRDQIVNDIRGSYGTGFILFNLNGAVTRNAGIEVSLRGTPVRTKNFNWDVTTNYDQRYGRVISLPNALPESYVSDTWLYRNIRNGVQPGLSTESLTGFFYQRNKDGRLVIDPTTGLPLTSTTFVDAGYNRTPRYTVGLENVLRYRRTELRFLLDMRRGGDIFNATQHYLFTRGLAMNTLDRNVPRVIEGVLRDGRENSPNPTPNNIVVVPNVQNGFYVNASEELFIERNINWIRLADVRFTVRLPQRFGRSSAVFVSGTDLFLLTNYTGLDPVVNGNSAAVGGSSGVGIDFGNFPRPRGLNFGVTTGF
jgi:TonB-linked SusC/RagA family outer membrane protein